MKIGGWPRIAGSMSIIGGRLFRIFLRERLKWVVVRRVGAAASAGR
jgi:hypothetical protein